MERKELRALAIPAQCKGKSIECLRNLPNLKSAFPAEMEECLRNLPNLKSAFPAEMETTEKPASNVQAVTGASLDEIIHKITSGDIAPPTSYNPKSSKSKPVAAVYDRRGSEPDGDGHRPPLQMALVSESGQADSSCPPPQSGR